MTLPGFLSSFPGSSNSPGQEIFEALGVRGPGANVSTRPSEKIHSLTASSMEYIERNCGPGPSLSSFLFLQTHIAACVAVPELPAPQQAGGGVLAGGLPSVCDHCTVKMTWNRLMDTASHLYYSRKVIVTAKKRQKATKQ